MKLREFLHNVAGQELTVENENVVQLLVRKSTRADVCILSVGSSNGGYFSDHTFIFNADDGVDIRDNVAWIKDHFGVWCRIGARPLQTNSN